MFNTQPFVLHFVLWACKNRNTHKKNSMTSWHHQTKQTHKEKGCLFKKLYKLWFYSTMQQKKRQKHWSMTQRANMGSVCAQQTTSSTCSFGDHAHQPSSHRLAVWCDWWQWLTGPPCALIGLVKHQKRETSAHESYLFPPRPSSRFLGNEINFILSPISPCWALVF